MHSLLSLFAAHLALRQGEGAIATMPMSEAQNIRCQTGVFATPPVARVSTTIAPESADVTKKTMTIAIAMNDSTEENGKCSRKLNRASATSC